MKSSIVLGKIKGIQVEINLSWIVVFILVTTTLASNYFPHNYPHWNVYTRWLLGSIIALLLFSSVLLHELSHSVVSKNLGIKVNKISLFIFGGIAEMEREPDDPSKELKIAAAGPAMSIFLYLVITSITSVMAYFQAPEEVIVPLSYVGMVNLVLAAFNLIPAFPMDGGRILRALIWRFKGNLQVATGIASSLGGVFGYILAFLGIYLMLMGNLFNGIWYIFIGLYINQASKSSYQNMLMTDMFNKIRISEFMTDEVIIVDYYISVHDLVKNYFFKYKFVAFPVRRDGEIIGMVTLDSVKKIDRKSWIQTPVGNIIIPLDENLVVAPDDIVTTALGKLFRNSIGRVLVMDGSKLTGIISRTDILNYIRIYSELQRK